MNRKKNKEIKRKKRKISSGSKRPTKRNIPPNKLPADIVVEFKKALELKPDYAEAYSELFYQFQQICAWQKLESMTAKLNAFTTSALDNGTIIPENKNHYWLPLK